ncbi:hypothetical protein D3C85_1456980 [compost metagenome]
MQHAARERGPRKTRTHEHGLGGIRAVEPGAFEVCVFQQRAVQACAAQVHARQVGAREVHLREIARGGHRVLRALARLGGAFAFEHVGG